MINRWMLPCIAMFASAVMSLNPVQGLGQEEQHSVEELTARADVVAVGIVVSRNAEWSVDRKRIWTRVVVAVTEQIKGTPADELTLTVPGGEIGEAGEFYSHAARFTDNEEVVVFADRDVRGNLRVTAGEQGKLTVERNPATGVKVVGEHVLLDALKSRIRHAMQRRE